MAKCIYKSDALNVIAKLINENKRRYDTSFHRGKRAALKEALEEIEKIKGTDEKLVKRGRWINHRINDEKSLLHGAIKDTTCSECGKSTPYKTDYCMHCGAKMDGGNEDENG